jgi:bifunctional DNase/RNase
MPAATQEAFIDMRVKDVRKALGTPNPDAYVVLLEERGGDRRLPIWIGHEQALGLALRLEGAEVARPLTYDLMASAIAALGGRVRAVRIDRLSEGTFYATVVLEGPEGTAEVDARPSDALNLALTSDAPVQADRATVEVAAAAGPGVRATLEQWDRQDVRGSRAILEELAGPAEPPAE